MSAYLSTVLADSQRHARFSLTPATRINQAQAAPAHSSCHQNSPERPLRFGISPSCTMRVVSQFKITLKRISPLAIAPETNL
jgi:hypothetical protein